MRYFWLLLALLLWSGRPAAAQSHTPALFPFVANGRWGFIDSTGAVVIAPRFAQVQPFSEGLAPAREGESYGYIDRTGRFVLPPVYAFASPFWHGLAQIQQGPTPGLLDYTGQLLPLTTAYKRLEWQPGLDGSGTWLGMLRPLAYQVLTASGRLLTRESFVRVGPLSNNRLVVQGSKPLRDRKGNLHTEVVVGVLDAQSGQLIIPYHRFSRISTFRGGVAAAILYQPDDAPSVECLIDTIGRILTRLPQSQAFADSGTPEFSDGVMPVRLSRNGGKINAGHDSKENEDSSYPTVLTPQGQVLFHNQRLRYLSNFAHGRAWAQDQDDTLYLVNKQGRRLSTVPIRSTVRDNRNEAPTFAGGVELVELANDQGYAALDINGQVVRRLPTPGFQADPDRQCGDLLVLRSYSDTPQCWGFWNWRTGLLLKLRFEAIDPAGYQHGLLAVRENNRLGYLAPDGHYVWREAAKTTTALNLDYMRRSFYQVASAKHLPKYAGYGGWAPSDNRPKSAGLPQVVAKKPTLQVAAAATPRAFEPTIDGHRATITNTTADTAVFDAQDSSLYLTVQAQDTQGQWRDIEYTPSSWCGNSYHQVFLAPGQYWQLVVPAYAGGLKTQLRLKLIRRKTNNPKDEVTLYSNSFAGSVNAAQFWRQEGHSAQGIMDPYNN